MLSSYRIRPWIWPSHIRRIIQRSDSRLSSSDSNTTLPVPPIPPASTNHHDLDSFLAYADRTSLSPTSTTYIGTHYEYTVQSSLHRLGFALTRTGGRLDAGIDLLGTWNISSLSAPLRVVVQCKALRNKAGPNMVRELEGTLRSKAGAPVGWRDPGVFGVLVSTREATKGVRDTLARTQAPAVWLMVSSHGVIRQALWNRRAEEEGLCGISVGKKYTGTGPGSETSTQTYDDEVVLLLDGKERA